MRDLQIVPAATFDHFDFFSLSWLFGFFFLTGSVFSSDFYFFIFYISFSEFGYYREKKNLYWLTGMGPQIV